MSFLNSPTQHLRCYGTGSFGTLRSSVPHDRPEDGPTVEDGEEKRSYMIVTERDRNTANVGFVYLGEPQS